MDDSSDFLGFFFGGDFKVMMPAGGAASRANQKTALAGIIHEKKVDQTLGELLKQLEEGQVRGVLCLHSNPLWLWLGVGLCFSCG